MEKASNLLCMKDLMDHNEIKIDVNEPSLMFNRTKLKLKWENKLLKGISIEAHEKLYNVELWHKRLGHINYNALKKTINIDDDNIGQCFDCITCKIKNLKESKLKRLRQRK